MHKVVNIDFEWWQFPKYEFEDREVRPPPRILTAAEPPEGISKPSSYLCGRGASLKTRPLDEFPNLYLQLKEYDPSRESHLDFARKYGLLSDTRRESWYDWGNRLNELVKLVKSTLNQERWSKKNGSYVRRELPYSYNLQFYPTITGGIEFTMVPRSLFSAIYLQCVSSLATGVEIRSCKACGKAFQIGGDTGQRSNRRFCSDHCRFEFNHRSRRGKS